MEALVVDKEVDGEEAVIHGTSGIDKKMDGEDIIWPSEWAVRNGVDDVVMDMLAIFHPYFMLKRKRD